MAKRVGLKLDLGGLRAVEKTAKRRAITLKAVKAGAKLVQAGAKARAPKSSGALRQSLGIKSAKGTRGRTLAYAVIGPRKKVRKLVKRKGRGQRVLAVPANYGHLVEGGTKPRGSHPGSRPKPYLRPAFDGVRGQAAAVGMKVMSEEIQKALAKQRR